MQANGLVISYFGNSVAVEGADGQVFQCHLYKNQPLAVVGDWVEWKKESAEKGSIVKILPRQSELMRGDAKGHMKVLAANIDLIFIVMAPPPVFSTYLIDRYLVAASLLNIPVAIVFNKIDLLSSDQSLAETVLKPYQQIGYSIFLTSIYLQNTLMRLSEVLKNKTAVLVGPSGVGKSSLISALGSLESIRVGDVSAKGAGKHTTTATRLYHLSGGGNLIDSPGVREFNLWQVSQHEILAGFKEFQLQSPCQFRDCHHLAEPGCAIKLAVEKGIIHKDRYQSYEKLIAACKNEGVKKR